MNECPKWCETDHEEEEQFRSHFGPHTAVYPDGALNPERVSVVAHQYMDRAPEVTLFASDGDSNPHVDLTADKARVMATLIERICKASPADQERYVAAIREAATAIEAES